MSTPEASIDSRVHVPLGGDLELYQQVGEWAPSVAGFKRFDLTPQSEGFRSAPGVELVQLVRSSAVLSAMFFIAEAFEGSAPKLILDSDLHPALNSFPLAPLPDWVNDGTISYASLLLSDKPLLWLTDDTLRVYADGVPASSTKGQLVIVMRVLPRAVVA